jgi:hypothetical protein
MNIFYLDSDARAAAYKHCDQHVNKMILESAQMMCTVLHDLYPYGSPFKDLYRPTHSKHPCTLWLADNLDNCAWLYEMVYHLNKERTYRFGSSETHKSFNVAKHAFKELINVSSRFKETGLPVALAMPDECKTDSPVESYHKYYIFKNEQWKKEKRPMKYYGEKINPSSFLTFTS